MTATPHTARVVDLGELVFAALGVYVLVGLGSVVWLIPISSPGDVVLRQGASNLFGALCRLLAYSRGAPSRRRHGVPAAERPVHQALVVTAARKASLVVGVVDAATMLVVAIASWLLSGESVAAQYESMLHYHLDAVFTIALPLSAVAGAWGYRNAQRIQAKRVSWYAPFVEGFLGVSVPFLVLHIVAAARVALAAGSAWDGAAHWGALEWASYVAVHAGFAVIFGGLGGACTSFLCVLNRLLLREFFAAPG